MSERLTFADYSPREDGIDGIYRIGADEAGSGGTIHEIAAAFDYELGETPDVDNLGELIKIVGPGKELQTNIGRVKEVLGTNEDAVSIARSWSINTGFLEAVDRAYSTAESLDGDVDLALITGGVRNWMERRANRLLELAQLRRVGAVLLAGGNRVMNPSEGPGVEEGMTEADYLREFISIRLGRVGISSELLSVASGSGNEVMAAVVEKSDELVDLSSSRIVVVGNAGNWVQNGGQFLRAAKAKVPSFDSEGGQLEVVSDSFELGTGEEPTATHQNPFSAAGQIVRNLQEFTRHAN